MTGTNLDLVPSLIAPLRALVIAVPLLVLLVLWYAWRRSASQWMRLLYAGIPLSMLTLMAVGVVQGNYAHQEHKRKLAAAMALFNERCKKSGLTIKKTVDGVKGIVLLRWRSRDSNNGDGPGDQYRMDDPYGNTCGNEECIEILLRVTSGLELDPQQELGRYRSTPYVGYDYLETIDPMDGRIYRYTTKLDTSPGRAMGPVLDRVKIKQFTARYGITWSDLSTWEDRQHWVTGSSLSIVDIKTREVLAERIVYMIDKGLGIEASHRSPWETARRSACGNDQVPSSEGPNEMSPYEMKNFSMLALRPN